VLSLSESRWEMLGDPGQGADVNAVSEFRNDSSVNIEIKSVTYAHLMRGAAPGESARLEISKSPVFASETENNPFFAYRQVLSLSSSVALDDDVSENGGRSFGRGDLILEPGESLFVNVDVDGTPTIDPVYHLEYEF